MNSCFTIRHPLGLSIIDLVRYVVDEEVVGELVTRVSVPERYRGQGHARELMRQMLSEADSDKVDLYLGITPGGGLTFEELESWYIRNGFKRVNDGLYVRKHQGNK